VHRRAGRTLCRVSPELKLEADLDQGRAANLMRRIASEVANDGWATQEKQELQ